MKTRTALWMVNAIVVFSLLGLSGAVRAESRFVRNGSLNQRGSQLKDQDIQALRDAGWTCPDAKDWPIWWNGNGSKMKVDFPATGGLANSAFCRLSGNAGLVVGYDDCPLEGPTQVMTVWVRGHGTLHISFWAYQLAADRKTAKGPVALPGFEGFEVKVDRDGWGRYRHLIRKGDVLATAHPVFNASAGTVDFDEVEIEPSNAALDLMVAEEEKLRGTGALIENLELVKADDVFAANVKSYKEAVAAFQQAKTTLGKILPAALEQEMNTLAPYVLTENLSTVNAVHYNDMLVLTQVMNKVAGRESATPTAIQAQAMATPAAATHKPGERAARPKAVTITEIRSNKVRYDENETATTKVTVVNSNDAPHAGKLLAMMQLDLDTEREIGQCDFSINPGETKNWSLSYSVGPETYGRGIEVRFEDANGAVLDRWQEFYAVAAEWFRVQQQAYAGWNDIYKVDPWTTYCNFRHYSENEPTDWGVQTEVVKNLEFYQTGQSSRRTGVQGYKNEIDYYRGTGVRVTFYQNWAYSGQMGYETIRQHPEFALYNPNGQFADDPVYGGYPNPMDLAGPAEIGPKRKAKPHLDRKPTSWGHGVTNLAQEDAIVFWAESIRDYAKFMHFDGVYLDGNAGVFSGYGYDGYPNVPSGKPEDYARLNGRSHRLFSEILKKDNPNFGIWYNWGFRNVGGEAARGSTSFLGTGTGLGGDTSEDSIRAAAGWKNVGVLAETGNVLYGRQDWVASPVEFLNYLLEQRDFAVQKWGLSTFIGYSHTPTDYSKPLPGPTKWFWATVNYHMAQILATQIHDISVYIPSYRPATQLRTRYSRFIWAPDIKVVPDAEKLISVQSSEEVWWKRFVYQRKTDTGHDLIIHLVRKPPYDKWDVNWIDEPAPLAGVRITPGIGNGKIEKVVALRAYDYAEEEQPVESAVTPAIEGKQVIVTVPPFRYHTMVVLRIKE